MLELFYPPVGLDVSLLVGTSDVPENVQIFHENGQIASEGLNISHSDPAVQRPPWRTCSRPTLLHRR